MLNKIFWIRAIERAIRTAAQTANAGIGVDTVNLMTLNWHNIGQLVLATTVLSLLMSIGGSRIGKDHSDPGVFA